MSTFKAGLRGRIKAHGVLRGKVQVRGALRGKVQANGVLRGRLAAPEYIGGEPYEGDYSATPLNTVQSMPTAGKSMTGNFIVEAVPYAEVSNTSNGTTVTIG